MKWDFIFKQKISNQRWSSSKQNFNVWCSLVNVILVPCTHKWIIGEKQQHLLWQNAEKYNIFSIWSDGWHHVTELRLHWLHGMYTQGRSKSQSWENVSTSLSPTEKRRALVWVYKDIITTKKTKTKKKTMRDKEKK